MPPSGRQPRNEARDTGGRAWETDVPFASLEGAEIGLIHLSRQCKLLLCRSDTLSLCPDLGPQFAKDGHPVHRQG